MKSEMAPVMLGMASVDQSTLLLGAMVVAVVGAIMMGARREVATLAVFAGVIGFIMTV